MAPERSAPATALSLQALADANRPVQLSLLEQLATQFTSTGIVSHVMVRGSLASGTVDRLSDVDLVVAVHDRHLPALIDEIDTLMVTAGAILPGWRDSIVADLGGTGYVYLLPYVGRLHQVDLYLVPTTAANALRQRTGAQVVYHHPLPEPADDERNQARARLDADRDIPPSCTDLITEAVVLHAMLRKRITRHQPYIAYGLLHQLHTVTRDLIKVALVPYSRHHGWYHLPDEVGATGLGAWCLTELAAAIATPTNPTHADADDLLARITRIAERVAPHALDTLTDGMAAYRAYQGGPV